MEHAAILRVGQREFAFGLEAVETVSLRELHGEGLAARELPSTAVLCTLQPAHGGHGLWLCGRGGHGEEVFLELLLLLCGRPGAASTRRAGP